VHFNLFVLLCRQDGALCAVPCGTSVLCLIDKIEALYSFLQGGNAL